MGEAIALAVPATIPEEEKQELQTQASAMLEMIRSLVIETPEQFTEAGNLTKQIVRRREEIKQRLKVGIADPAYQVYKRAQDLWKQVDSPYAEAETVLSRKLAAFNARQEEERRRREAEARNKAELQARRHALTELMTKLADFGIDLKHVQDKVGRTLDEPTQGDLYAVNGMLTKAIADKAKTEQEERFLREAIRREQEGDKETADLIVNAAQELPPPDLPAPPVPVIAPEVVVVPSEVPKVQGLSFRTDWKWEVVDVSLIPREYMMVNEVAINGVVRALKDKTNIPGIRVYAEQVTLKSRK
jgi:hypothetical protein